MPLSKLLTKSTLLFLSLNLLRVLSIVAICLVFAGEIYTMVSDVQGYNSASSAAQSPSTTSSGLGATASTIITRNRLARREFVPVALPSPSVSSAYAFPDLAPAAAAPTAAPVVPSVDHAGKMVKHRRIRRAASSEENEESTTSTRRVRTSTSTSSPTHTTATSSFSTALPTATNAPYSPLSQAEQEQCAYVGGTSIPRTTGGVVFGTLQRIFTALILLLSLLSELPLPPRVFFALSKFWTYAFPPFGPDFGPSVLGLVQVFVGSVVLARNNREGSWTQVSGWLLFLVGILNFLAGLAFGRRSKIIRSFSADSTSPSALRRLRLKNSSPSTEPSSSSHPEISSPFDDRHAPVPSLSNVYEHEHAHEHGNEPEMVAIAGPSFRPARALSPNPPPAIKRSASRNGPNGIVISPPRPLRPSFGEGEREEEVVGGRGQGREREGALSPPPPIYFPGSR